MANINARLGGNHKQKNDANKLQVFVFMGIIKKTLPKNAITKGF